MKIYHVSKPDETMKKIARLIGYSGKKFKLSTNIPHRLSSYWDGGSKDYFYFYSPHNQTLLEVHSNHPMFEPGQPAILKELPVDLILIEHSIFCGKDMGLTFYVQAENITQYLPRSNNDLSKIEKAILIATSGLKNTYAGQTEIRYKEVIKYFPLTFQEYRDLQNKLIQKGLLRSNYSITPEGRNAIVDYRYYTSLSRLAEED